MTFTLIERQKLGPNAYRVNQWWAAGDDQDTTYETLEKHRRNDPGRYDPHTGTHTLVLMAGEKR